MKKFLFFLFLFILLPVSNAEIIQLPYTTNSNTSVISVYPDVDNNTYTYITANDNEIYSINSIYCFSDDNFHIDLGTYTNNISFEYGINNYTFSEIYTVSDGFLTLKDVKRELIVYEDGVISNYLVKNFTTFSSAPNFASSTYTFLTDEIIYENRYSSLKGFISYEATLSLDYSLFLTHLNQSGNLKRSVTISYTKVGDKPKSYYVNKLHPILKYPYKLIERFDSNNNILNVLSILTFFLRALFFWITVIYKSFFVIQILILIGLIPVFAVSKSRNPKEFIDKMVLYYGTYFRLLFKIFKYIIDLIINLINLLPFI